jgi:hypothetical protein
MEGNIFGGIPIELELRLSVEDSPNSAGIVIDAIRCCKLALDRGEAGVLYPVAAYFMKHPPRQYSDNEAFHMTERFIQGSPDGTRSKEASLHLPLQTESAEIERRDDLAGKVIHGHSPWKT